MSTDGETIPERLRQLADVVDYLEDETTLEVQNARLSNTVAGDGLLQATLTVLAPIGAEAVETSGVLTGADSSETADDADDGDGDQDADVGDGDEEYACDVDDCDYTGSERGLAIHQGRVHGEDDDEGESVDENENTAGSEDSDPFISAARDRRDAARDEGDPSAEAVDAGTTASVTGDTGLAEADADDAPADVDTRPPTDVDAGDVVSDDETDASDAVVTEDITVDGVEDKDEDDPTGETEIEDEDEDEDDELDVELPEGVTREAVYAAVADHDALGDVATDLGITRGRARVLTVALDCYGDVRDVPGGGA